MSMTTRYLKRVATIKVLEQLSLQRNEDFQTAEDPFLSVSNYNLHKIFFKKKIQVVQDVRYFQRIKWQYLVLDEAQAIKSSSR